MLGSRLIMGKTATFGSAYLAALASAVVGFVAGLVVGVVLGAAAPGMLGYVQIIGGVVDLMLTGPIYAAVVKTGDGTKPSLVQGYLIYVLQLVVLIAVGFALVSVLHVPLPMPGIPKLGG
jgi:hypothetical protein